MRKVVERTGELSTVSLRSTSESWGTVDKDAEEPLGMEVGYSTPQPKALMWCLRRALSVLTTSMSMMSKRTWISPSGELTAS